MITINANCREDGSLECQTMITNNNVLIMCSEEIREYISKINSPYAIGDKIQCILNNTYTIGYIYGIAVKLDDKMKFINITYEVSNQNTHDNTLYNIVLNESITLVL